MFLKHAFIIRAYFQITLPDQYGPAGFIASKTVQQNFTLHAR
jgi:hypothetical protein